jgi:L-asparagine transporter-like permease
MKDIDALEASSTLSGIRETQNRVVAQGPRQYVPFIGWGLFALLGYSPFDYVRPSIWGPIVGVLWIVAMLATYRYIRNDGARVHIVTTTPWYVWTALAVLTCATVALAVMLQSKVHFAWSLAGLILAVPFIGYGLKLRAAGR